jgi:hypothetical protein
VFGSVMSLESILKNARYGLALAGSGVLVAASLLGGGNPVRAEEEMHESQQVLAQSVNGMKELVLWQIPSAEIELVHSGNWHYVPGLGETGSKEEVMEGEQYTFTLRADNYACPTKPFDDGFCVTTVMATLNPAIPDIGIIADSEWDDALFVTNRPGLSGAQTTFLHGDNIYLNVGIGTKTGTFPSESCLSVEYAAPNGKVYHVYNSKPSEPARTVRDINLHSVVGSLIPGKHKIIANTCDFPGEYDRTNNSAILDFAVEAAGNAGSEFTKAELDYLKEFQFGRLIDYDGNIRQGTVRFPHDPGLIVYIARDLTGNPSTPRMMGISRDVLSTVSDITGLPVTYVDNPQYANFKIYTDMPINQSVNMISGYSRDEIAQYAGFGGFSYNDSGEIYAGLVVIMETYHGTPLDVGTVIHEVSHGVGIRGHSSTYRRAVMNETGASPYYLPIEQRAIELLYSVPVGTTLSELPQLVDIVGN